MPREGLLIENPFERLSKDELMHIHNASLELLTDPGLICYNEEAASIFADGGADVSPLLDTSPPCRIVKIPERLVNEAVDRSPSKIILGARKPEHMLVMHGHEPKVHFVTGSETNIWLDVEFQDYAGKTDPSKEIRIPEFIARRGTLKDLCTSARVSEHLETLDGFIRNVNIQDADITEDNKDVNKVFASLDNTTKHVMVGLTNIDQLDNVVKMAELIAGGKDALKENPVISFITCLVKSPLQFVNDTTRSFIEICRRGLPVVVSSSPQAGTTAPIREAGIIAQINAEVLAGITLGQLVNPGTPIMYGSVPVRTRMDTLADSYGAVETSQYNIDCVQLARHYGLPNYSTSGVCDPKIPGQQSSVERLFSNILVTLSGPQFLHCAYGLLDCNSVFCLLQAVLDDAHFKMIKFFLQPARCDEGEIDAMIRQIRDVAATPQKLYIRTIRKVLRSGLLSPPYPFEGSADKDEVFARANDRMEELLKKPVEHIDKKTTEKIFKEIPGILPRLNPN
ncbi:MAG: trimethylamine methyltransferase family protein [Syntrophales bacterium]|nr:trimethylamine methyltransferase family protein [Syntrophales bacterium]MDY0043217.1 trimethylamine methyltransferase family protein [Syntrophales bacterium]